MIYSELARLLAAMPHTLSAAAQAGNAIAEDKAKQLLYLLDLKNNLQNPPICKKVQAMIYECMHPHSFVQSHNIFFFIINI